MESTFREGTGKHVTADAILAELFTEQARANPFPLTASCTSLFLRGMNSVPVTLG